MTSLLPNAKQQFLDVNGKPLAAGSVYFYVPGTTTPKTTWQDAAQTQLNTNPVLLDAAGEAIIFGSGQYRQQVFDQAGNLIWDQLTSDISFVVGAFNVIANVTALRALTKTSFQYATTLGYYKAGDGGGGSFYLDAVDTTSADNGGSIIVATDGGRWKLIHDSEVSVRQFGAKGDGINDDTAAIQAAINSLVSGGDVIFQAGTYKITNTLQLGNGSATQASTLWSIRLVGEGTPPFPAGMFAGYPSTGGAKILWAGQIANMISVNGPLNGWGVENLYLDGATQATRGITVTSASFGHCANLAIQNCTSAQIYETTLQTFVGFASAGSFHNEYRNIALVVPAIAGAIGIVLTGTPTGTPSASNSSYAKFSNVVIEQPPILNTFGVYLQWTDSAVFENLHIFGGSATSNAIFFDYTLQNNMPSGCEFFGVDPSGSGTSIQWGQAGTPGAGARPNYIQGLSEINLGSNPRGIANLIPALPKQMNVISLTGQTAAIANGALFTTYEAGIYRVSYYQVITTGGTGGTISFSVNYNDGFTVKSQGSTPLNASGAVPFFNSGNIVFQASGAIVYNMTFTGVTGAPVYALYATIERIG